MKYLKISNQGEIDFRLVALMGGTTKSKDVYKIGQFGTGLKYTMAFFFRNNIDFKIFSGDNEIKLHLEVEEIRGDTFEIICIDGHRTSITTKMGEDWQTWMIIREIWCNALDEGNPKREIVWDNPIGEPDQTTFYIQLTEQVQQILDNWNKYFIHGLTPLHDSKTAAIYPGTEFLRVYKHGVLIHESQSIKSLFNYDIKNADINELREYRGYMPLDFSRALVSCNENVATYFIENITEKYYEGGEMSYSFMEDFNDSWRKVIGAAKLIHPKALKGLQDNGISVDLTKVIIVPTAVYRALTRQFAGIGALSVAAKANEFYEKRDETFENMMGQALLILTQCGYEMSSDLKYKFGVFQDVNMWACVNVEQKIIYISISLACKSIFEIITTLMEENAHYVTGLHDNTRSFQQYWIDLYAKEMLKRNGININMEREGSPKIITEKPVDRPF